MEELILNKQQNKIEKNYKDWKIFLINNNDSIIINVQNNNLKNNYQSTFHLKYLLSLKLFKKFISIKEIIDFISILINENNIIIEEDGKKLVLISPEKNMLDIEFLLEKEEEKKIKVKKKIQLKEINLKQIKSFKIHNNWIRLISIFPSGNLISVSSDKSIKIFDIDFNFKQIINNAHRDYILYVDIKNENNFVTCSYDKSIKIWEKNNKKEFSLKQEIKNAHADYIFKVIYCLNGNLISCSRDGKIKIWEENLDNKYQLITILDNYFLIISILLLEDKNILISAGDYQVKFYNLNNFECIKLIKEDICYYINSLKRIDENRIILGGNNSNIMKVISISEKKIIRNIKNNFICWCIYVIEKKGIFLIGGQSKDIIVYRSDNYQSIQIIKDAHIYFINGFIQINDNLIGSYGHDGDLKIWKF